MVDLNTPHLVAKNTETLKTTGMIFPVIIGAMLFGNFMAISGAATGLAEFVGSLPFQPVVILIFILLLFVIVGCFMDCMAAVLIIVPVLLPTILTLGFDILLFGVLIILIVEMGLITPPVGMNVFGIAGIAKDVPMYTIFGGILPFVGAIIVCVAMVIAFPQIALFLPNIMK